MKKFKNMKKNIALIGMPGSGKTSIGREIAKILSLPFYDIDEYIENKEKETVSQIFLKGENYFRKLESEAVEAVSKNCPSIISTGGGSVKVSSNMEVLKRTSIIVFINRPLENIINDIDISGRPLLADGASRLYKLYEERYHLYKKYSDIEILNDQDFNITVNKVIELLHILL
ncbi:shikimate kinase [Clostridiales bacterium oral taxon 876 str. F0540]|nr:shikimate kinase [Clostridiales bacterium oral taxon 876 str. F0540]